MIAKIVLVTKIRAMIAVLEKDHLIMVPQVQHQAPRERHQVQAPAVLPRHQKGTPDECKKFNVAWSR